ncbi:GPI ethanolamine phosphate transferase 3 isoform X3 [Phymastichus coffea]|uniref:GPI ethanolamine phosphate transferase 3 isoform X3 n=1 Tax=Phymastichus coffea TaxID=108790 RepID=UPI00273CA28C|nr:GPI ethanolamine phosphate transferase 3 isoform X3 [Phymastichus coffea]
MTKLFKYICILFWIIISISCGLFLFINGFFLKKNALFNRSNCSLYPRIDIFNFSNPDSIIFECLKPRARLVLLVIDALKFEFVELYEDTKSKESFYRNKLPVINEILKRNQNNSKLLKFIADPPTTTMQRLKSITTGTLPTFIDIHENFGADNILEDNFIDLNIDNGNIFMGDDTWTSLYPKQFKREYAAPSFDVSDLDTVDTKVKKKIFTEINKNDWSLLIAHMLGVDHCGHKHGKNHPEMLRKLNETNYFINDLVKKINQDAKDTILFVIGDHGMTDSGDHGGDSNDEIETVLFIYSTLPLIDTNINLNVEKKDVANQIDIVPTISVILGIPIPFSNIGNIILEAIPSITNNSYSKIADFNFLLHSLWKNIYQIQYYIDTYSFKNNVFDKNQLQDLQNMYNKILINVKMTKNESDLKNFIGMANEYFTVVRKICYEVWVQFDSNLMTEGLILFCSTEIFLFVILNGLVGNRMYNILESPFLMCVSTVVFLSIVFLVLLHWLQVINNFENNFWFYCGLLQLICFIILIINNWKSISKTWYEKSRGKKYITNILSRLILLIVVFGVFSNSYIIEEDKILSYFLISQVCYFIYSVFKNQNIFENLDRKRKNVRKPNKRIMYILISLMLLIVICLIIRSSNYFWRYREEQRSTTDQYIQSSTSFVIGKVGSITSRNAEVIFVCTAIISLTSYIAITKIWLRNRGNLSGYSANEIIARFILALIVVLCSAYWILKVQQSGKVLSFHLQQVNFLPLIIYVFFIIAILCLCYQPLAIHLHQDMNNTIRIYQEESSIPKMYKKMKNILYCKKNKNQNSIPIVFGLGTVYSACYILLIVLLSLMYALLLGFVIAPSVVLMNLVSLGILYITAVDRIYNASNLEQLLHVPSSIILCWFLIAEYFFYATGHQSSFSTIHWEAGFYQKFVYNTGFNTFGSHFILAVAIPLLVIAPFTLRHVCPSFAKEAEIQDLDKQGELILYQNDTLFHSAIFSVAGKYILFHAARVLVCMFATTIHCRHLMVWRIFAPKLIFESLSFIFTAVGTLMSLSLLLRIENCIKKFIVLIT